MTANGTKWWLEGLKQECVQFQIDLSCLVDGELDERAAARAITHIETCGTCRTFFEDVRQQVEAHRDMQDPEVLMDRYNHLLGAAVEHEIGAIELVTRLANIFYQLGKAYALTEIDPRRVELLFEKAVPVEATRTQGRGFVDGVLASGRTDGSGGVDWAEARHLFNGRLGRIEGGLAKGRRLLEESLRADPNHEEARLWLAQVDLQQGRMLKASKRFREVFDSALKPENRGHAAVQLALLHSQEDDFRTAILYSRWITLTGLADDEERFFFVRFNLGNYYARLGQGERAIQTFRELLDRHPERAEEIAGFFLRAGRLRACIDAQPGMTERLFDACPELFREPNHPDPSAAGSGSETPS